MKVSVLAENTSCSPSFGCEHGLSLHIEINGHRILFDMGQTTLFADHAEKLGVDLSRVDHAVLSHGHYDHGGGLRRFLQLNDHAPVYLSRFAFEPHYNGEGKYIGLDTDLMKSDRFVFIGEEYEITEGIALYSCNDRKKVQRIDCAGLSAERDGRRIPEDFRHEQYLLISENKKRILVSGCSHKGIVNIMNWFHPDVLIGGFHLMKMPMGNPLADLARELDAFDTAYYTCHCTGAGQYAYMKPYMKNLHYLSAGQTIVI
ncbi:MAG: MBL fold metallo-hydrolase [Ruminococcus sp.]|nr:MBL fold metallo-hydrolase [Ruminococcus sp.]